MAETGVVVAGAPARLDAFVLAAAPQLSRRLVHRLIAEGAVRVNGRPARKGLRLRAGDAVTVPQLGGLRPEPETALAILHEDGRVVAVEKPGGMRSHALDPRERGTAAGFVLARWPETAGVGDPLAPGLVHRLDTGTSGILVAARTPDSYESVRAAFAGGRVEKRYLAVVAGAPPRTVVRTPLAHEGPAGRRMRPARPGERAWPAESAVEPLATAGGLTLVGVLIRSGVTHQVRAHLASLGCPVAGDRLYGGPEVGLAPGRHALHAAGLVLAVAGVAHLALESPLPDDMAALVPARSDRRRCR